MVTYSFTLGAKLLASLLAALRNLRNGQRHGDVKVKVDADDFAEMFPTAERVTFGRFMVRLLNGTTALLAIETSGKRNGGNVSKRVAWDENGEPVFSVVTLPSTSTASYSITKIRRLVRVDGVEVDVKAFVAGVADGSIPAGSAVEIDVLRP